MAGLVDSEIWEGWEVRGVQIVERIHLDRKEMHSLMILDLGGLEDLEEALGINLGTLVLIMVKQIPGIKEAPQAIQRKND